MYGPYEDSILAKNNDKKETFLETLISGLILIGNRNKIWDLICDN
jgi:hypothetical protein